VKEVDHLAQALIKRGIVFMTDMPKSSQQNARPIRRCAEETERSAAKSWRLRPFHPEIPADIYELGLSTGRHQGRRTVDVEMT